MTRPRVLLAAIPFAVLLAGCAGSITKDNTSRPPASNPPAAAASPAPDPAGSPSGGNLTGPAGTTYTVTGNDGPAGAATTYDVTMTRAVQHARLGQDGSLTNGSDHVTAAEFRIEGKSGQTSDDANNDAVVVGSDGQDYTPAFDTIAEGTNFDGGDFRVGPGQSVIGWVVFELPQGVSIAAVQWTPGGGQAATWHL